MELAKMKISELTPISEPDIVEVAWKVVGGKFMNGKSQETNQNVRSMRHRWKLWQSQRWKVQIWISQKPESLGIKKSSKQMQWGLQGFWYWDGLC